MGRGIGDFVVWLKKFLRLVEDTTTKSVFEVPSKSTMILSAKENGVGTPWVAGAKIARYKAALNNRPPDHQHSDIADAYDCGECNPKAVPPTLSMRDSEFSHYGLSIDQWQALTQYERHRIKDQHHYVEMQQERVALERERRQAILWQQNDLALRHSKTATTRYVMCLHSECTVYVPEEHGYCPAHRLNPARRFDPRLRNRGPR